MKRLAALSEGQIRNSGASNVIDLSRNFAGLTMTDLGPGQSQVAIRSAVRLVGGQPPPTTPGIEGRGSDLFTAAVVGRGAAPRRPRAERRGVSP